MVTIIKYAFFFEKTQKTFVFLCIEKEKSLLQPPKRQGYRQNERSVDIPRWGEDDTKSSCARGCP